MTAYKTANTVGQQETQPHRLALDERKKLTVSGVTEVVCFDSDSVILKTVKGVLSVRGEGLKLRALTPSAGNVEIEGSIDSIAYTQLREGGFFRRLFG